MPFESTGPNVKYLFVLNCFLRNTRSVMLSFSPLGAQWVSAGSRGDVGSGGGGKVSKP